MLTFVRTNGVLSMVFTVDDDSILIHGVVI